MTPSLPAFSFRRATAADAVGILRCLRVAFEPYGDRYTPQAFDDTVLTPGTVHHRLASMAVFVAITSAGEIVGTIGCNVVSPEEGHIRGMAVLPGWQGTGVAAQLLQAAEGELRSSHCRRVTLDTTEPLLRAMRFYERNGYRRSGKVDDFFGMRLFEYVKNLNHLRASLDHLILGASNLARGIEFVEERTGVRAAFGGVHPGRGTHNALLSLGPRCYLEILAPDPKQQTLAWFRSLPQLAEPRLVGWMVHPGDVTALAERLRQSGITYEGPIESSRLRHGGRALRWKLLRLADSRHGLPPILIEWSADSPHPAEDAPSGLSLERFEVFSPDPDQLQRTFEILGVDLPVVRGDKPRLHARIAGPKGTADLIS
jgi:GNAT superfamily N-acetyltransferase